MADENTSPHLTDGATSPLEALALRALRRFGEMSASTTDADVMLNFLDYGNEILDDLMAHPYHEEGVSIPYYRHQTESRAIPDHVVVSGLLFRHARDQKSKSLSRYEGDYYLKLNQLMTRLKFGPNASYELKAVDYE